MNYKERQKRIEDIKRWRKEKVPQTEMSRRLGVTRQRVQQIERQIGLNPRRVQGVYKSYPFVCVTCGKEEFARVEGRKFCSRECFFKGSRAKMTPEEREKALQKRREKNRKRSREYYHNVFKNKGDWKDIVKKRNSKYIDSKK